jgi:Ca2+-binding RTX toxin-like protein
VIRIGSLSNGPQNVGDLVGSSGRGLLPVIAGGRGNDRISVGGGAANPFESVRPVAVLGGGGRDEVTLHGGFFSFVLGGSGDDRLRVRGIGIFNEVHGGFGRDRVSGGEGPDLVLSGQGRDVVAGEGGVDLLVSGQGEDRVAGGKGRDLIAGGPQIDRLHGGASGDFLLGGRGNDRLFGGHGGDLLAGGGGRDRMIGGPGEDRAFETGPPGKHGPLILRLLNLFLSQGTKSPRMQVRVLRMAIRAGWFDPLPSAARAGPWSAPRP